MSHRARLFVALELPEQVRGVLAAWGRVTATDHSVIRLIAREHLHVTLCFLGWRQEREIERLGELVGACAEPVPGLALAAAAWLPPRRPRVLAVDLDDSDGALGAVQARVSDALAAEAGYVPEKRRYRPHVTVARVPRGERVRAAEVTPPDPLDFAGEALTLYRSHLGREGARYEAVARAPLSTV